MRVGVFLLVISALFLSMPAPAALTRAQKLGDFQQLVALIERNYGPLQWKKDTIALDWKDRVTKFRARVKSTKDDNEFYRTLTELLASLQDAHITVKIPSTYKATLGFSCDYVAGKVLINEVDTLRLPEVFFPFKKGDQVLALGGVAVDEIIDGFSALENTGYERSRKRIAAARLTNRAEALGYPVPRGVTTVTVLPKGADRPFTVTATWIVSGLPMIGLDDLSTLVVESASGFAVFDSFSLREEIKKLALFDFAVPRSTLANWQELGLKDIGNPKSMFVLPEGAKQIDGLEITAAIYEAEGKKIGVLRIPSYGDDTILPSLEIALEAFERETDVLVLDQTNNPGGSVELVTGVAALFADRSYKDVTYQLRPSLSWLEEFQRINNQVTEALQKDPQDFVANALKARFEYLETEMRAAIAEGRSLTAPISLNLSGTFGMIQPETKYTKPVLLLINEFALSGGDALPAILRDNRRATLFGHRTTGAGGNVGEFGPLAHSFFKFKLTQSLMVRPNGEYLENKGVAPDIEYEITETDFANGYKDYVAAFTREALKLIGTPQ